MIDALLRPTGAEHWSPSERLPHRLPTPPSLPETVLLRADGEAAEALLPLLPAGFLGSTHAKEALITPKGVRLVVLVDEAERGPYLVLRQARFATAELDADRARSLLEQADRPARRRPRPPSRAGARGLSPEAEAGPKPPNPYLVLAAAILLPGVGHVLAGYPQRGLTFLFFTLLLGTVTWEFTTPEQSFVGRAAGGLFVYAISITDAYKLARIRYEGWRRAAAAPS